MTYSAVNFTLTESQMSKLRSGKKNKEPVVIQVKKSQIGGEHTLYLTNTQIKKLKN